MRRACIALPLVCLSAFAAPPPECGLTSTDPAAQPAVADLANRLVTSSLIGDGSFSSLPLLPSFPGCGSVTRPPDADAALRNPANDMLRGLPLSDLLLPLGEAHRVLLDW